MCVYIVLYWSCIISIYSCISIAVIYIAYSLFVIFIDLKMQAPAKYLCHVRHGSLKRGGARSARKILRAFQFRHFSTVVKHSQVGMSRSYGIKKDFGLYNDSGVLLSATQPRNVASSSKEMSSYRSTMPAYRQHTGGRGQHGRLNISSASDVNSNKTTRGESNQSSTRPSDAIAGFEGSHKSSRGGETKEKKPRTWFNKSKKSKKAPENDIVEVARVSPMLHIRSLRGGEKDQFGRPQAEPEESKDEEVRMQLSYDAPEDITKSNNLSLEKRKSLIVYVIVLFVQLSLIL